MHPTSTFELHRQQYGQRLARSHQERVVEAARAERQPSENTRRPPDPWRAVGQSAFFAGAVSAR
ncbi:hypothetical protein [Cellulomonas sp. URHD0024]|uniref:hypothetical protein n=1 Tax=Cellulomonas sp. URHD0024 TaxID=1302620 RepID=UPI0004110E00|nr:hypothetical protein [Cellulomonas sp. URHD0024]